MKLADARGRYDYEMRAITILFCVAALAPAQSSPPGSDVHNER
jgi:hypothetical protein